GDGTHLRHDRHGQRTPHVPPRPPEDVTVRTHALRPVLHRRGTPESPGRPAALPLLPPNLLLPQRDAVDDEQRPTPTPPRARGIGGATRHPARLPTHRRDGHRPRRRRRAGRRNARPYV